MLLENIDKYIQEVELHDKVWKGIIMPEIDLEDYIALDEEDREEIYNLLDEKTKQQIIKLQEGGLC